ncbi:MAG: hypothetical protein LBC40_00260, partial [Dysgonamonadaceae bacterium]|nr:hypothetical protein [Dysgonamonadaceae bacterium]
RDNMLVETGNPIGVTVPAGRNVSPETNIPSYTGRGRWSDVIGCTAGTTSCITAGGVKIVQPM